MTSSQNNYETFFEALESSLRDRSFVKLILSKPQPESRWKKIIAAKFLDARGTLCVSLEYFDKTQTKRVNIPYDTALQEIRNFIPEQMHAGHLKTSEYELVLQRTPYNSYRLKRSEGTAPKLPVPSHNREKRYLISPDSPFLVELGIALPSGTIRRDKYDKFRQIQKFIEIISGLVPESVRCNSAGLSVVDFGSGKHYLTFAMHEFFQQSCAATTVRGIEQRPDLVSLGQTLTQKLSARNLSFVGGSIAETQLERADLVVALHACNTATDDALAKAIRAQARFICVAPCCHAYVRQRLTASDDLRPMLRHGIVEERFSESLTDSLRVLVLEALGYQTKLFEFISPEHTAKNTMITALRTGQNSSESREAIRNLKAKFRLPDFYLDTSLADLLP